MTENHSKIHCKHGKHVFGEATLTITSELSGEGARRVKIPACLVCGVPEEWVDDGYI